MRGKNYERRIFIKKKILFLTFTFLFICKIINVNALNEYDLVKENYENIYYVQNGLPEHYGSDIQFKFSLNGKTAYCINPKKSITSYKYEGVSLNDSGLASYINDTLNIYMYYGYDYPGHQDIYYYMATQAMIWRLLTGYDIEFYTQRYGYGENIDISKQYNEIATLINRHNNYPYFAWQTYYYSNIDKLELYDEMLSDFEIVDSNYSDVFIDGNTLKINNLENYHGLIKLKMNRKMYTNDEAKYYYSADSQEMISGGKLPDIPFTLNIQINGSDLVINKKDYNSYILLKNSNSIFNVKNLDNGEYLYLNGSKDLKVNDEGQLFLNNISHGNYEITEISTDDRYMLGDSKKILFDLNTITDNKLEVNYYNTLKRNNLIINKIDSDTKVPISDVAFEIYPTEDIYSLDGREFYSKDVIYSANYTNDEGKANFYNIISGNYCIKEVYAPSMHFVNNDCYNVYINSDLEITLENSLKKSNLIINKKDLDSNLNLLNSNSIFRVKNIDTNEFVEINGNNNLEVNIDGQLIIYNLRYVTYEI